MTQCIPAPQLFAYIIFQVFQIPVDGVWIESQLLWLVTISVRRRESPDTPSAKASFQLGRSFDGIKHTDEMLKGYQAGGQCFQTFQVGLICHKQVPQPGSVTREQRNKPGVVYPLAKGL